MGSRTNPRIRKPQPRGKKEQTLEEYRTAIQAARNALDEMEKEIEEELGTESPDPKD